MAGKHDDRRQRRARPGTKKAAAEAFLLEELANGPRASTELIKLAQDRGLNFSTGTLMDARISVGVVTGFLSNDDTLYWWLTSPPTPQPADEPQAPVSANPQPTAKQIAKLREFGQRTDVDRWEANRIISAIADNGWKLPDNSPESAVEQSGGRMIRQIIAARGYHAMIQDAPGREVYTVPLDFLALVEYGDGSTEVTGARFNGAGFDVATDWPNFVQLIRDDMDDKQILSWVAAKRLVTNRVTHDGRDLDLSRLKNRNCA